jgi:NTP pyrophosphatase (non-canonical NTP hydrolase)
MMAYSVGVTFVYLGLTVMTSARRWLLGRSRPEKSAAADVAAVMSGPSVSSTEDSIGALLDRIRAFRDARDWRRFHTPRNLATAIAVECGELLEHFQWIDGDEAEHAQRRIDSISEELADVAIYVFELADALAISLPAAIAAKIELNELRYPVHRARGRTDKHTKRQ